MGGAPSDDGGGAAPLLTSLDVCELVGMDCDEDKAGCSIRRSITARRCLLAAASSMLVGVVKFIDHDNYFIENLAERSSLRPRA
jgi:hypothetical protein